MANRLFKTALRALDANGNAISGAKLECFETGTSTPVTTYTDSGAGTAQAFPVVADSTGTFAEIYVSGSAGIKVDLQDANGASLAGYPVDPVYPESGTSTGASAVSFAPTTGIPETDAQSAIVRAAEVVADATPQLGGPLDTNSFGINGSKGADVASAATLPLVNDGDYVEVSGTTTITGFAAVAVGKVIYLRFKDTLTLTNGTNLKLPGGANIVTANSDQAIFIQDNSTPRWRCINYEPASGKALVQSSVLQVVSTLYTTSTTSTTEMPYDDTIPQNTEGAEYFTVAITPKSATSTLLIEVVVYGTPSGAGVDQVACALFQDTTVDALAASGYDSHSDGGPGQMIIRYTMTSGTTSETTFKIRAGRDGGGTFRINGDGSLGARLFGGVLTSSIIITEIE